MSDVIRVNDISVRCSVGVPESERIEKQDIKVDLEIFRDLSEAAKSDRLKDTIDYASVYKHIERAIAGKSYRLLEAVAEDVAGQILSNFEAERVRVRVRKAALEKNIEIEIERAGT